MQKKIDELKISFRESLGAAASLEALEALRVEYLGKKGHVATLMQELRFAEDKKAAGQLINSFKTEIEGAIADAVSALRDAEILAKVRGAKNITPPCVQKRSSAPTTP